MLTQIDPLLMNAFNTINLAGAVILTSTEMAKELGVPESKWVYPLGGAGTRDSYDCKSSYLGFVIILIMKSGNDQTTTRAHRYHAQSMQQFRSLV